jgi:hypothetical protein
MLVRYPDGTFHAIDKALPDATVGTLGSVPIPGTDLRLVTLPDGRTQIVNEPEDTGDILKPTEIEIGGQPFAFNPNNGTFTQVEETYEPGFLDDTFNLFQQRSGAISQLAMPQLDDIITQALVDGEFEKAFAYQDFRDRPSAAEAFETALQFARSPADQQIVSDIARGGTAVDQAAFFDPNRPRRIGPQPDFLISAFNDFQRRTAAGRAPTQTEAEQFRERLSAGATPATDARDTEIANLKDRNTNLTSVIANLEHEKALSDEQRKIADLEQKLRALQEQGTTADGSATKSGQEVVTTPPPGQEVVTTPPPGQESVETSVEALVDPHAAARQVILKNPEFAGTWGKQGLSNIGFTPSQVRQISEGIPYGPPSSYETEPSIASRIAKPREPTKRSWMGVTKKPTKRSWMGVEMKEDDGFAGGGVFDDNTAIVGEEGPELIVAQPGTFVLPLGNGKGKNKKASATAFAAKLKAAGMRGLQTGGIIFGGTQNLPLGLRQLQASRPITPPRGYLLRRANLQLPSAQALANLTPESVAIFEDQARLAGIPMGAFEQELRGAMPKGQRLPQAKFKPLPFTGVR